MKAMGAAKYLTPGHPLPQPHERWRSSTTDWGRLATAQGAGNRCHWFA